VVPCGALSILSLMMTLAVGCDCSGGAEETPPPTRRGSATIPNDVGESPRDASVDKALAPASADKPIPTGAAVFVDVSGSMRGFVSNGGDIRIETLHLAVGNALSKAGAGPVDYCEVGSGPKPKCNLEADAKRYRNAKVYAGASSQISAALAEIPPDAPLEKDGTIAVSPVDARGVSVVLTDGIEVSDREALTPGEKAAGCLPGLDTYCFQRVLTQRARAGYGIWLHVISLDFNGRVYPERGMNRDMYAKVNDYLAALRTREGPYKSLNGKGMRITPSQAGGQGDGFYRFEGVRPLLILVMSRDIAAGRKVSQNLAAELETAAVANPPGRHRFLELAPYGLDQVSFDPSSVALDLGAAPANEGPPKVRLLRAPRREVPNELVVDLECEADGKAFIGFAATTTGSAPASLPERLQTIQKVELATQGLAPESVSFEELSAPGGSRGRTRLVCRGLRRDRPTEVSFDLKTGLEHRGAAPDASPPWWSEWTSPDTYSQPERMHRLADLVEAVLETNKRELAPRDRLTFSITRLQARIDP